MPSTKITSSSESLICRAIPLWMQLLTVASFIALSYFPVAAAEKEEPVTAVQDWRIGYYAWNSSYLSLGLKTSHGMPLQLLYVATGEYRKSKKDEACEDKISLRLPNSLPPAEKYVAVVRIADANLPDAKYIQGLMESYQELKIEAQKNKRTVIGLQLDYDCPTNRLAEYARFLTLVRSALPKDELLSITALLDWFRPGTAVADVINNVDEFVPQFYDVAPEHSDRDGVGVAQQIEPKWGTVFNAFAKPYRVGIASFGRIVGINRAKKRSGCSVAILDVNPLELFSRNRLEPRATTISKAGERLVRYGNKTATANSADGACRNASDEIKMIIPTKASISTAYAVARKMGSWCKGVLFFRWPVENEAMVYTQSELDGIIAGNGASGTVASTVEVEDGLCTAVSCNDLFLTLKDRFPEKPVRIRIHSSTDLEYFLPDNLLKPRLVGLRTVELIIPANAGVPRIRLGRAVSREPATFRLEEAGQ